MSHTPHTRLHVTMELVMDRHDDAPAAPQLDAALREWSVHRKRLDDDGALTPVGAYFKCSNGIWVRESFSLSWPWPLSPA